MTNNTVWASILAFACILFVLGLLLCIPFVLARVRGVSPRVDRMMDSVASLMGADPPPSASKGGKHPAPKQFLRSLTVTKYAKPDDLEAAATEDCCAICCCEYESGQPIITLSCSHMFHRECIFAWLHVDAVCPICKTDLLPQPEQHKAPDCHCGQHGALTQPPPAATTEPVAAVVSAAAPAGSEQGSEQQHARQHNAAVPASAAAAAVASTPLARVLAASGSPRAVPASPRMRLPALHPHALSSPMIGVAGLSP